MDCGIEYGLYPMSLLRGSMKHEEGWERETASRARCLYIQHDQSLRSSSVGNGQNITSSLIWGNLVPQRLLRKHLNEYP